MEFNESVILEADMYDTRTFLSLLVSFSSSRVGRTLLHHVPICHYFNRVRLPLSMDIYGLWSLLLVMTLKEMIGY
jgi:hypothetical protein